MASVMVGNGHTDLSSQIVHPSWFKPELFLQPDFSPQAYIASVRKYVPLDQVSHELERYLAALKSRLVEVINEDYNDFVSLSTKLVNIDGSVLRMQKPLLELKERLGSVQAAIRDQLDALNQGLARRQQVASCRTALELMQDTAHVMSKVEKLVTEANEAGDVTTMSHEELSNHARLLERVGGEMARLQFFSARGAQLPFMQQLSPRMTRAMTSAETRFGEALQTALAAKNHVAVNHCLHAFASVNATKGGEEVIRRVVIRPIIMELVKGAAGKGPTGAGADVLSALLPAITTALTTPCSKLLEATLSPQGGLQSFNLLGGGILAEVDTQLAAHAPGVFSPGVPDTFHSNYQAAMAFLTALESQCQTHASVVAFRECAAYASFTKRWNVQVYYSLRFQQIAGGLEEVLRAHGDVLGLVEQREGDASGNGDAGDVAATTTTTTNGGGINSRTDKGHDTTLHCIPTHATRAALQRCADRNVVLRPLSDRFVRLSLQSIMRCVAWVNAGLTARAEVLQRGGAGVVGPSGAPLTPATHGSGGGGALERGEVGGTPPRAGSGVVGEVGTPRAAGGVGGGWGVQSSQEVLTLLAADLVVLQGLVEQELPEAMVEAAAPLPVDVAQRVTDAYHEGGVILDNTAAAVRTAIADTLAERCMMALKQLRGIVATFRMSNKAEPTRPSHYVAALFVPLKSYTDSQQAGELMPQHKAAIVQMVADTITERYQSVVDDTLTTVRKTESSLKRLKGRRGGVGETEGGEGAASTDQMLCKQLLLDVQEYGRQLQRFGVDATASPTFKLLWAMVAPPGQADIITL